MQRRSRQRGKLPRLKKTLREILSGRLTAQKLLQRVKVLVGLCGGWKGLLRDLKPVEHAKLSLRLAEMAESEVMRAEEKERRRALSEAELRSPEMREDLLHMALDAAREHPWQVMRAIAAGRHRHMLLKALTESEQGREVLERAGWHQTGNRAL